MKGKTDRQTKAVRAVEELRRELLLYPAELNPEFSPACSHSRKMSVEGEKQLGLMNIRETETTDPISTYRLSWSP